MSLSRETPASSIQSVRGVFVADPYAPPVPPPGARAIEIRNANDEFVAWIMVPGEHADEYLQMRMLGYLDHRDPVTPASSSSLRLLP